MNLQDELNEFIGKNGGLKVNYNTIGEAPEVFKSIARCILSGHFEVSGNNSENIVKVIPTTVELYYHEEDGDNKDYIVYHRNLKRGEEVPYFKLGILHNHISGIDITFESEARMFRASALIRAFKPYTLNSVSLTDFQSNGLMVMN